MYPESGVPDGYHAISHHQENPTRMERYAKLNTYHMSVVARFVEKLKSAQDGEGSLLDHSLMLYGSPMANSNAHDHYPLPVVVFGHGAGRYRGNEHILAAPRTPMANLFMSIAAKEDIELDELRRQHGRARDLARGEEGFGHGRGAGGLSACALLCVTVARAGRRSAPCATACSRPRRPRAASGCSNRSA